MNTVEWVKILRGIADNLHDESETCKERNDEENRKQSIRLEKRSQQARRLADEIEKWQKQSN